MSEAVEIFEAKQYLMRYSMRNTLLAASSLLFLLGTAPFVAAQPKAPTEDDYYKMHRFTLPEGEVLEAGALEMMPDGKVALGTRRGEIWMIDKALTNNPADAVF